MKKKLVSTLVALPLLAVSALASAEPVELAEVQMDAVTAGGLAGADAVALAIGSAVATYTYALSMAEVLDSAKFEVTTIKLVGTASIAESSASASGSPTTVVEAPAI